jgi:hypothetical protein
MAVRWATGLTKIDNAEAVGSWNGFRHAGGGTPTPGLDTDFFVQNTSGVSIKVTGATRDEGMYWDFGSGTEVDFTTAGHFWGWVQYTTNSLMSTMANGGLYVIAASDAAGLNWSKWYVGGSDTITGDSKRFLRIVLDLNKTPSATAATAATISSVRHIGFGVTSSGTAKSENLIIDRCDYGDAALQVDNDAAGNITVALQDFYDEDSAIANKYGIIDKRGGIFYLRAGLTFGDAAQSGTTTFNDSSGLVVEFENPVYHNGSAVVSSIDASALYKISAEGAASQNTSVTFGTVVGSGDDRQGISGGLIRSAGPKFEVDFETNIANLSAVNLYGLTLLGAGLTRLSGSTKTDVIGFTAQECDEVQPNDAEFLNNNIISPVPDRGLEIVSGHNIKNVSFVAGSTANEPFERVWQVDESTAPDTYVEMTDEANSATTGDWIFFPATEAINDFFAVGSKRKFREIVIDVGTAGSGGSTVIAYEYWSGSAWTALTGVVDGTTNLKTAGINSVTFVRPNDWAAVSLNGESPLYYVRGVITVGVYTTTNPAGDEGAIGTPQEHSTHAPAAGTFAYDNLKFFGSPTAHIENPSDATTEDSYPDSNQSSFLDIGPSGFLGWAQSFTGAGGVLSRIRLYLRKQGSPTGNATVKVYAHSGTFGTSSVPTGSELALASTVLDVSTLTTTLELIDFEFEDELTLVNTTKYVLSIEYPDGNGTDFVRVGSDNTSPTHGGNPSRLTGGWFAITTQDMVFFVYTGAIVKAQASNLADPSTDDNTGSPPGATIIENSVTLEINGVTEGTQCSIHTRAGGPEAVRLELMNKPANASGVASALYNFQSSQPVVARARSGGIIAAGIADDGGVLVDETLVARMRTSTNDVTLFPASPVMNVDQYYIAGLTEFDELLVRVGTAGVGTYVLLWEYWNGAWTTLTTTTADDFKSVGDHFVRFTPPGDWATTTINSQGPFFYVRARWTSGTMTTSPIGNNISASVVRYLPWFGNRTITSAGLTATATWSVDTAAGPLG